MSTTVYVDYGLLPRKSGQVSDKTTIESRYRRSVCLRRDRDHLDKRTWNSRSCFHTDDHTCYSSCIRRCLKRKRHYRSNQQLTFCCSLRLREQMRRPQGLTIRCKRRSRFINKYFKVHWSIGTERGKAQTKQLPWQVRLFWFTLYPLGQMHS